MRIHICDNCSCTFDCENSECKCPYVIYICIIGELNKINFNLCSKECLANKFIFSVNEPIYDTEENTNEF